MSAEKPMAASGPSGLASRPRRSFLARALGLGAGAAGLASAGLPGTALGQTSPVTDAGILNFALNLEYLEAEFYTYALTGEGLAASGVPTSGSGAAGTTTVKPGAKVPFESPIFEQFATELATDEQKHVVDIRNILASIGGTPIAIPSIDLLNSFNLAAQMAGLGNSFDPFASETNFLIGAFIFEDVGVTAYHGAAPLIQSSTVLGYASSIYAVEAYHAGAIRTFLNQIGQGTATRLIANLRAKASGGPDFGVINGPGGEGPIGNTSIVLDDADGRAFARSFRQVLNIAYLSPNAASGGFFPNGVNGTIIG